MSDNDDKRNKEIEMHIYGARLLLENLWTHLEEEFGSPDEIRRFIEVMLEDITEFYKTHEQVCEECLAEQEEAEPTVPGVVLPFPVNKGKDWGKN